MGGTVRHGGLPWWARAQGDARGTRRGRTEMRGGFRRGRVRPSYTVSVFARQAVVFGPLSAPFGEALDFRDRYPVLVLARVRSEAVCGDPMETPTGTLELRSHIYDFSFDSIYESLD